MWAMWMLCAAALRGGTAQNTRPNIVFFIVDDQDTELGSMAFMPKTEALFHHGARFSNAFSSSPLCCPSRSTVLTGVYAHNHNVTDNAETCHTTEWKTNFETRSFAHYLQDNGYHTGYFGKYLNKYRGDYIPPGWNKWFGQIGNTKYYNYKVNDNGAKVQYGSNYETDYFTDLVINRSIRFVKDSVSNSPSKVPFAVVLSMPAPHGTEDAAPQYQRLFYNVTTHRTPNWNYAPNRDKGWFLQRLGKMEPVEILLTDFYQTKRLQTLQSVDDAVERMFQTLTETNQLDNTYVVYTSDHGYHLGHFGIVRGKNLPYEFDTKIPLYVRGPGIASSTTVHNIVGLVDLAPTFLDFANIPVPSAMDGTSLKRLLVTSGSYTNRQESDFASNSWRDTLLIEAGNTQRRDPNLAARPPIGSTQISKRRHLLSKMSKLSDPDAPTETEQEYQSEVSEVPADESIDADDDMPSERSPSQLLRNVEQSPGPREEKSMRLSKREAADATGEDESDPDADKSACSLPHIVCETMTNNRWRFEPVWQLGQFCFCVSSRMNSSSNCLRTINATHNFLYCEFYDGFTEYYDMLKDPWQLRNAVFDLPNAALQYLHGVLYKLKSCTGAQKCSYRSGTLAAAHAGS